jgi:hypothetical protein
LVGSLTAWSGSLELSAYGTAPPAGLLFDTVEYSVLAFDGYSWSFSSLEGRPRHSTGLAWRPTLAEGGSLRSFPLSWSGPADGCVELAGLGPQRTLYWGRLQDGELVATNAMSAGFDGPFLAAAVVRDGLVAAVRPARVDWLRCGAREFRLWRTTDVAIPAAVACAVSRPTAELLVVSGDGTLTRLPVPA